MVADTDERPKRSMASSDAIPLPQDFGTAFEDRNESREQEAESLFNVNTSDLQLIEETEKNEEDGQPEGEGVGIKGPVEAIGVRAFKMLEILREQDKRGKNTRESVGGMEVATVGVSQVAYDETEDSDTLLMFNELMEGCSRKVRARGFFNLINLVNSQFVKATQTMPFSPISITPGTFF